MVPVSFCGSIHNVVHLGVELFGFNINLYTNTRTRRATWFIISSFSAHRNSAENPANHILASLHLLQLR